jgi:excisionase family DNA binding protein
MTKEREKVDKTKEFLSAAEVARWLGLTKPTVLGLMHDGDLIGYHFKNAYKFKPSDVEAFIEKSRYIPGQKLEDEDD